MKIETKYDIGQKVWYRLDFDTKEPDSFIVVEMRLTKDEVGYSDDFWCFFDEQSLYPTKEACEQAIKEMERND